jgi:O-antigen/teichoic acid export membrane protein
MRKCASIDLSQLQECNERAGCRHHNRLRFVFTRRPDFDNGAAVATDGNVAPFRSSLFYRLACNVGWLLGGQGVAGLFGLVFLGLAARALGPIQFGLFALALTFGQLASNVSHFESWKGVIRFGALHRAAGRNDGLARLLGFSTLLDWASAVAGAALAVLIALLAGPWFGWDLHLRLQAAAFAAAMVLASGGTPTGILRLCDRFDLLAGAEAVAPLLRMIGAIAAWALGGGVSAFLGVWAGAALLQLLATWSAALAMPAVALRIGWGASRQALLENDGLWRFMWQTSIASSLRFVSLQAGTIAVGAVAGPASAGGFRLADRLAVASTKPAEQLARAVYPELAHLVASDDQASLRRLFYRASLLSVSVAAVLVLLSVTAGRLILTLVAGSKFAFAQPFLVVLGLAASIELAGFILEPFHNAHGNAGGVLRARLAATATYLLMLLLLLRPMGAMGAAYAAASSAALFVALLALEARRLLADRSSGLRESSP